MNAADIAFKAGTPLAEVVQRVAQAFDEAGLFFGHGTDNATDEAWWLVTAVLGISYADPAWQEHLQEAIAHPPETAALDKMASLAAARIETRKPLAYLLGESWFAGLRFYVDESVLVPRSPIASLIATGFKPWLQREGQSASVLDLCTGSGCIAIAMAMYQPYWQVDASDISPEALAVAEHNVAAYDIGDRVRLIESDLFGSPLIGGYDLIVSNPPYVDAEEMRARPQEFREEPGLGLAAGDDGLELARIILADAAECLNPGGILVCEVGASDEALQAAYREVPFTWLTIQDSEPGVFVIDRETLVQHDDILQARRIRG